MPFDLRPEHLELIKTILRTHAPAVTVWAFGSRARGSAKPTSDLDLVLMDTKPIDAHLLGTLREAFEESSLPIKVDLLDWAQTSPSFQKIIEEQKVAL